jgi:hypothetical protein
MNINTARKIQTLYAEREDIDRRNSQEAIEQTLAILQHGGLHSARCYTGTSTFTNIGGMLFMIPNTNKRVYAAVYVGCSDEYNIDYIQINKNNAAYIRRRPGIYVDQLQAAYKRMYDDYINEVQDGFISI